MVETTLSIEPKPARAPLPHQFAPGNNANPLGRPKGSRNKLGEDFLKALHESWQERGAEAINRTIDERPWDYLKVIAGILPQKIEIKRTEDMSQDDIDRAIMRATSLLAEVNQLRAVAEPEPLITNMEAEPKLDGESPALSTTCKGASEQSPSCGPHADPPEPDPPL